MDRMNVVARRVTLRELRLLLAVAQSGSILKAANEIGVTQPALSKSISNLEGTFGVRLFDRTNRGVAPTPHGEILLRRAAGIFDELRQAVDELGSLTDASRGELHIGGTPTTCAGLLPRIIGSVRAKRPRFNFHVAELESDKLGSGVLSKVLDLALGRDRGAGHANELAFDRLFDDRLFIVAGAQHPLTGRRSVALEEAADHQWVLPATGSSVTLQLRDAFRQRGLDLPQPTVTTMSIPLRYELIATDSFLTVLFGSVIRFGNVPRFLRVLPIDLPTGIPIGLLRLKNRTLSPSAEVFIQAARETVRPMHSLDARRLRQDMR